MSDNKAVERVLEKLGSKELLDTIQEELSLSDLNTLLLELFRQRAHDTSYAELMKAYASNRFVQPAAIDPIALKQLEIQLLTIAQQASFQAIQLSPAAPLGSCSVVATSDQNKVISASRGTEIVADATNLLALHICDLIKTRQMSNEEQPIRFSTTHRHVRAQHFNKPGLLPHFHVYGMVTSGKDKGSYSFEKRTFLEHIQVYETIFKSLYQADLTVKVNRRDGYTDSAGLVQRLMEHLQEQAPSVTLIENKEENHNQYYKGFQFTLLVTINGKELNIGDGGFVDWPQKLLGGKKERMMISAIGLDRLLN